MAITRLPGYITIQMVRFHFKQKEAVNAKVLKDVNSPSCSTCSRCAVKSYKRGWYPAELSSRSTRTGWYTRQVQSREKVKLRLYELREKLRMVTRMKIGSSVTMWGAVTVDTTSSRLFLPTREGLATVGTT